MTHIVYSRFQLDSYVAQFINSCLYWGAVLRIYSKILFREYTLGVEVPNSDLFNSQHFIEVPHVSL